jgi:hypothetical protein
MKIKEVGHGHRVHSVHGFISGCSDGPSEVSAFRPADEETREVSILGLTLSPDQIISAPPKVRRWLEQEIAVSLGLGSHAVEAIPPTNRLVGANAQDARAILESIWGVLPGVSVFFELSRISEVAAPPGFVVFSLAKIFTHSRLVDAIDTCASGGCWIGIFSGDHFNPGRLAAPTIRGRREAIR